MNSNNSNNSNKSLLTADEAVYDLTLALLYLQRVSNRPANTSANNSTNKSAKITDSEPATSPIHYWDVTAFKSSTSYDPEILGWLQEVGFVSNYKKYCGSGSNGSGSGSTINTANIATTKSLCKNNNSNNSAEAQYPQQLILTKAGVLRAREILNKLGVSDWDKAEILKNEEQKL